VFRILLAKLAIILEMPLEFITTAESYVDITKGFEEVHQAKT
jgi:hypothetical protein